MSEEPKLSKQKLIDVLIFVFTASSGFCMAGWNYYLIFIDAGDFKWVPNPAWILTGLVLAFSFLKNDFIQEKRFFLLIISTAILSVTTVTMILVIGDFEGLKWIMLYSFMFLTPCFTIAAGRLGQEKRLLDRVLYTGLVGTSFVGPIWVFVILVNESILETLPILAAISLLGVGMALHIFTWVKSTR